MYLYHFGIRELPFTLTPNTDYFFGLPTHTEALDVLKTALMMGEGFIKVTGEVGTGKTLICRKLLNTLSDKFVTAYIPNPYLSPSELRRAVASELEVDLPLNSDQQQFTHAIGARLVEIRKQRKAVVLIIDEAQALSDESLEALRLMTNLETETAKLMQVVLFGQPELDQKLQQDSLRQLRQRITFSHQLSPMDHDQIYQYVNHRMQVAGYSREKKAFSKRVCKLLFKASSGTPRLVNIICHKALMLAYGEGKNEITKKHLKLAINDTEGAFKQSSFSWLALTYPVVFAISVGLVYTASVDVHNYYEHLISIANGWLA